MKHVDPQNDLNDGFEPGPIVAGPDGTLKLANKSFRPEPPRLCQAGPCRHYHTFAIQMDVETPKGDSVKPGGKVEGGTQAQPFYVERHHYCYPTVGVESTLGALPVLECSLWEPIGVQDLNRLAGTRDAFSMTAAGVEWQRTFDEWKASLAPAVDIEFRVEVNWSGTSRMVSVIRDCSIDLLRRTSIAIFGELLRVAGVAEESLIIADGETGDPFTNLQATLGQLGIQTGHVFWLTKGV